jgi:2-polyprenyl-3-methyl-5-hydroxy-6-metoxy-1,4-benzoquinol methylase
MALHIPIIDPENPATDIAERLQGGIYRFAEIDNYTNSFGFQWKKFSQTQSDEAANQDQSRKRFFAVTGWDKTDLTGQAVLEVGCGAGRFSEVVLKHTQAQLYSVDYSAAVEVNYAHHHQAFADRFTALQASIYALPFPPQQFDKVFCFGVLQHTPDVRKSVASLAAMVKPGGELVVDFYPYRGFWTKWQAKYWLRPFTKKMSQEALLAWIERNADSWIRWYFFFEKIGIGRIFNRFLPICDIRHTLPPNLSAAQLREWVVLDTLDMLSPAYDQPQRIATVRSWFEQLGFTQIFAGYVYVENQRIAVVKGKK